MSLLTVLTASPLARVLAQPAAADAYTLSAGRLASSVAGLVGLAGAVLGGLALARAVRRPGTGNPRRGALAALVAGPSCMAAGAVVAATADGGVGTGNGLGGAYVALLVGLAATALGGLALARIRRAG
ncbi:DUF6223 family protein [Actinomadura rifamycini]|uniref:DUF6223 family protein n=1 Tax=Actinomadura rifamycini TaxID=31962 RepID=UPI00041CBE43|nr:DUF6223 family protein [Actinomadura rifamycini]